MAKIPIVDDEAKIRAVKTLLTRKGFEVECVYDGKTGEQYAELGIYDLLILDIMMPKLDGYSACKKIKSEKDIPIIMLSARGEEYDKLFGFELGIDDYVVKPFSPRGLQSGRGRGMIEKRG